MGDGQGAVCICDATCFGGLPGLPFPCSSFSPLSPSSSLHSILCSMFVAMDSKEEVVAVATYTLTETDISRLTDKTLITIMDPVVKTVSLERHAAAAAAAEGGAAAAAGGAGGAAAGTASFRCLHVLNASRMLINARSTDQVAFKPSLSVTAFQG